MIDEGYLVRLFLQTHLSAVSVSGDRGWSPLPGVGKRGDFHQGNLCPAFRQLKGRAESISYVYIFSIPFGSK